MSDFRKMSHPGICDVCGNKANVVVCASAFGGISHAYCKHCLKNYLEPYGTMVSYISCAGNFPDDINEDYQKLCRHILKELDIPEEKFIADVKKANDDFMEWANSFEFDEEDSDKLSHEYMKFDCPECGAPLKVYYEECTEFRPRFLDSFEYERCSLIRHCENCGCDWENEWWTENGDVGESELRRKFWG